VEQRGIDFYRRLLDELETHGIEPLVQLHHWDLPQRLQEDGGWLARDTAERFADYAEICWRAFGDRVQRWSTHNEPWIIGVLGYLLGIHAPGHRDPQESVTAMHHVLLSHGMAVRRFRALAVPGEIGIVLNTFSTQPLDDTPEDHAAVHASDGFTDRWFLDPLFRATYPADAIEHWARLGANLDMVRDGDLAAIAEPIDFLGVNYYARRLVTADPTSRFGHRVVNEQHNSTGLPVTGGGWAIHPPGLTAILLRLSREYGVRSLLVTENGSIEHDVIDADGQVHDPARVAYLRSHVAAAEAAIAGGAPLHGYYAWSLMDNFEWADGYGKRFGLVYVDYATQRRIPKDSARFWGDVARRNGLEAPGGG
jgi:beta-glucosidase